MTTQETITNVTVPPPEAEAHVIFMQDGQCHITYFVGENRYEAALRYAQGLFDEGRVSIIRLHELPL